jgi:hypothetical protein
LSKEIAEKSHQLRQMRGEDLEGLNVEQLQQLERSLEIGLGRVIENKVLSLATIINQMHKLVNKSGSFVLTFFENRFYSVI